MRRTPEKFKELKDKIMSQLVFALLKREGKFQVEINVSGYASSILRTRRKIKVYCIFI